MSCAVVHAGPSIRKSEHHAQGEPRRVAHVARSSKHADSLSSEPRSQRQASCIS
ncbi:hypothetical protein PLICRDRAFT_40748 [Plicaturopsis crispa FD-325 SS-3]|nr:hypothetical protein PLICRDRAFT_40748 [Plicaturopsis crispa FD-325 SS-3]